MDDARINQIWRAGYCQNAVVWHLGEAANSESSRLEFMRTHTRSCMDCTFANILKGIEQRVASEMGPEGKLLFYTGRDISKSPSFQSTFRRIMDESIANGSISPSMILWMKSVARRVDYAWKKIK